MKLPGLSESLAPRTPGADIEMGQFLQHCTGVILVYMWSARALLAEVRPIVLSVYLRIECMGWGSVGRVPRKVPWILLAVGKDARIYSLLLKEH